LAKDKVPGIPRDEDTLADILIERGLAIPKSWPDGRQYRYWQMQPEGLDNPLYLLRLKSAELIFSGEPPLMVAAREINEPDSAEKSETFTSQAPKTSKQAKGKNAAVLKQSQRTDNPASDLPEATSPEPTLDPSALPDSLLTDSAPAVSNAQPAKDRTTLPSVPDQGLSQAKSTNTEKTASAANPDVSTTDTKCISNPVDSAKCWLESHGDAGQWLMDIAAMLNQGQWQLGRDMLEVQDKYLLPFPATAEKLAVDPPQFIKTFEATGWLVTDVLSPMRKVQTIQSVRGILLALEPSLALKALLKSQGEASLTASFAQTPSSNTNKTRDEVKPSQPKDETFREPKPVRSKSNTTGTQKSLSGGNAADSSVNSQSDKASAPLTTPPANPGTIDFLITHVRQQNIPPDESSPDGNWHTVSNTALEQFLSQHPTVKRTRLMLDIANHSDCRSVSATKGIQVRLRP
jgi:conjugal transfer pilus assembly protein TraI